MSKLPIYSNSRANDEGTGVLVGEGDIVLVMRIDGKLYAKATKRADSHEDTARRIKSLAAIGVMTDEYFRK